MVFSGRCRGGDALCTIFLGIFAHTILKLLGIRKIEHVSTYTFRMKLTKSFINEAPDLLNRDGLHPSWGGAALLSRHTAHRVGT